MYIAMNRFKVKKHRTDDFENIWKNRDSYLNEMPGFQAFHLLQGPEHEDHILYSSHTVWDSHQHFKDWTTSEAFRKAHANAGTSFEPETIDQPNFEGFQVIINEQNTN